MKALKISIIIVVSILLVLLLIIGIAFLVLHIKTQNINTDTKIILENSKYQEAQIVNVDLVKQEVSCGYAVIEMFSNFVDKDITEQSLYKEYGKIVTSTGKSFEKEMNKQFPEYETKMFKYLTNEEFIDKAYDSLKKGMPVPFEWAAKLKDEWTLHYSLLIGIDITNDKMTVLNPYGYTEEITLDELLSRTTFIAYEKKPAFINFAFAFGAFEKNTLFIVDKK